MKTDLKVATIIGTRPEIIRLSSVIKALEKSCEHTLIHTGQNWDYNLNEIFFKDLKIKVPDHYLESVGNHLGETIGNIISKSYEVLNKIKPDALLILGDTNSALAAISAKRLKIPIFHMEAGNRCFDQNVPEEINRKIVDHISDVNLAYTEHSRKYLHFEGLKKEHVFVTGSPMPEVLHVSKDAIDSSAILQTLHLKKAEYIVVSAHREENIDIKKNFDSLMGAINFVAEKYKLKVVFSVHPRTKKRIEANQFKMHSLVQMIEPLGFLDYCHLQKNAHIVLSDSGTLSEESSILGFRGVLLRTSTERPEVVDKGSIVIGCIDKKSLERAIQLSFLFEANDIEDGPVDYKDINVSEKVVKIIHSYTPIINQVVWRKQ